MYIISQNLKINCFDKVVEEYQNETKIFYNKQLQNKKLVSYLELPCYITKNKVIKFNRLIKNNITKKDLTVFLKTTNTIKNLISENTVF